MNTIKDICKLKCNKIVPRCPCGACIANCENQNCATKCDNPNTQISNCSANCSNICTFSGGSKKQKK